MTSNCFVFLLVFALTISPALGQLPADKDLLLWIGEGNGNQATDATANKNHGTIKDGAKWVDGANRIIRGFR